MYKATVEWERTAMKWRTLAEKRRDHHFELYRSGRWEHYYTEENFMAEMRKAVALAGTMGRDCALAPGTSGAGQAQGAGRGLGAYSQVHFGREGPRGVPQGECLTMRIGCRPCADS